jgi:hypothetical protein
LSAYMAVSCRNTGLGKRTVGHVGRAFAARWAVVFGDAQAVASLSRERHRHCRRTAAERDAEILARTGVDPDLAAIAEHAASEGMSVLGSRVRGHAGIAKGIYKDEELDCLRDEWKH